MNAQQIIAKRILDELAEIGHGHHGIREAFDKVMGEGAFDLLASEVYDELRAA